MAPIQCASPYQYDSVSGQCTLPGLVTGPGAPPPSICPPQFQKDPVTGNCVPVASTVCTPGYQFDSASGQCVLVPLLAPGSPASVNLPPAVQAAITTRQASKTTIAPPCNPDWTFNPSTGYCEQYSCPTGYNLNPLTDMCSAASCPGGYQLAADGTTCNLVGAVALPPAVQVPAGPGSGVVFQQDPAGNLVPGTVTPYVTNNQGQTVNAQTGAVIPYLSAAGQASTGGQAGTPGVAGGSAGATGIAKTLGSALGGLNLSGLTTWAEGHITLIALAVGAYVVVGHLGKKKRKR